MTIFIFSIVICAALLHATWNALMKSGSDKLSNITAIVMGHMFIAIGLIPFVPLPSAQSYIYILIGIALHVGYQFLLVLSYQTGDLTQVYPIARGTAPLLVTAISIFILGVELSHLQLLGILIIGAGLVSMSLIRGHNNLYNLKAVMIAMITGGFIAGYSLIDGLGVRLAQTALGFYTFLSIGNGLIFIMIMFIYKPDIIRETVFKHNKMIVIGGGVSFLGYLLILYAFMHAPIALVTALRETSIIFAFIIGVFILKEPRTYGKFIATIVIIFGAMALKFTF